METPVNLALLALIFIFGASNYGLKKQVSSLGDENLKKSGALVACERRIDVLTTMEIANECAKSKDPNCLPYLGDKSAE